MVDGTECPIHRSKKPGKRKKNYSTPTMDKAVRGFTETYGRERIGLKLFDFLIPDQEPPHVHRYHRFVFMS